MAGLDVGSRFVKACVAEGGKPLATAVRPVSRNLSELIAEVLSEAAGNAGCGRRGLSRIAATGRGAALAGRRAKIVPAGRSAFTGALALNPGVGCVADAGGLHLTVTARNARSGRPDSVVNERCAAGSGKFLEMVARALGVDLADVSRIAAGSRNPYPIAATCAVFAESEVISRVNAGAPAADILAGVIASIAARAASLLSTMNASETLALAGGLSLVDAFREELVRLHPRAVADLDFDPRFVTAFGAALLAGGGD